jgi:hypothetical protein
VRDGNGVRMACRVSEVKTIFLYLSRIFKNVLVKRVLSQTLVMYSLGDAFLTYSNLGT